MKRFQVENHPSGSVVIKEAINQHEDTPFDKLMFNSLIFEGSKARFMNLKQAMDEFVALNDNNKVKHKQFAFVEFRNGGVFLYQIESETPITINKFAESIEKTDDFNEDRDSITFVDEPIVVKI